MPERGEKQFSPSDLGGGEEKDNKVTAGAKDLYSQTSPRGERWGRNREGEWREPEPHFAKFLETYKDQIGPRVLDIGCGPARHIIPMVKEGFDVTGIDINKDLLADAKERLEQEKLEAELIHGNHHHLRFPDASFDSAVCIQTAQMNNEQGAKDTWSEMARVVKPGGLIFFRARSTDKYNAIDNKPRIKQSTTNEFRGENLVVPGRGPNKKDTYYHHYSLEEIKHLAQQNGLEIIEEPIDETEDKETGKIIKGQWNVVMRKKV